jgi:sugar/nucleoside kinase (ribokinase family)
MSAPAELTCIGDISVDTLVSIDHLPRRDEKQWAKLIGDFPGGMSANLAVTFARLGGSVALVAHVGRDARGATSIEHLRQTAVDISRVTEVDDPTFWTMSLIDARGERSMVEFASEAIHPPWELAVPGAFGKIAYTIGSETSAAIEPFRQFQARGMITAVDADYAEIQSERQLEQLLGVTTVFFCNSATARRLTKQRHHCRQ